MPPDEVFRVFIMAIFYVGKGKRSRPYAHLNEALNSTKVSEKHLMFNPRGESEFCLNYAQNIEGWASLLFLVSNKLSVALIVVKANQLLTICGQSQHAKIPQRANHSSQ